MKKYIVTETQLKKITTFQLISEDIKGFDPKKAYIDKSGNLNYNGISYKISTAGKQRQFEYFNFDGDTLKMKFRDGKPQEYSTSNWIWGGKIKDIIEGIIKGLSQITILGGQLMLTKI